jgi:hypothetical protein
MWEETDAVGWDCVGRAMRVAAVVAAPGLSPVARGGGGAGVGGGSGAVTLAMSAAGWCGVRSLEDAKGSLRGVGSAFTRHYHRAQSVAMR